MIVDLGDVGIELQSTDERRADVLLRHLAGGARHGGPASAVVRYEAVGPQTPGTVPRLTIEDLRLWHEDTTLWLSHTSGASAVVTMDEAWVGGGDGPVDAPFHRMLLLVVTHLLAHHRRYVLHAAAVVPGDHAVLVLGDTGKGKSTTALAGLEADWPVLADDMVVVRAGRDGPEVAGIARPGAVPGDVAGHLDTEHIDGDMRRRRALLPSAFTAGWFPVGAVVRVGHGHEPAGELHTLDGRNTMYALMSAFGAAATPAFLRSFLPTAAVLSRGPAFELLLGADPAQRLSNAARLLRTARSARA